MADDHQQRLDELFAPFGHGDEAAGQELLRDYGNATRRYFRRLLETTDLRRLMDSEDLTQSHWVDILRAARRGQLDLDCPEQLRLLLRAIAHNKVRRHTVRQHAARRDSRRVADTLVEELPLAAPATHPSGVNNRS